IAPAPPPRPGQPGVSPRDQPRPRVPAKRGRIDPVPFGCPKAPARGGRRAASGFAPGPWIPWGLGEARQLQSDLHERRRGLPDCTFGLWTRRMLVDDLEGL